MIALAAGVTPGSSAVGGGAEGLLTALIIGAGTSVAIVVVSIALIRISRFAGPDTAQVVRRWIGNSLVYLSTAALLSSIFMSLVWLLAPKAVKLGDRLPSFGEAVFACVAMGLAAAPVLRKRFSPYLRSMLAVSAVFMVSFTLAALVTYYLGG